MDKIEKFIFLSITNKQLPYDPIRTPKGNSEYLKAFADLNEEERKAVFPIENEVHAIYSAIEMKKAESIDDYHDRIEPVSDYLLKMADEFELTLRSELSEKTKQAIIDLMGQDYFDENFND